MDVSELITPKQKQYLLDLLNKAENELLDVLQTDTKYKALWEAELERIRKIRSEIDKLSKDKASKYISYYRNYSAFGKLLSLAVFGEAKMWIEQLRKSP